MLKPISTALAGLAAWIIITSAFGPGGSSAPTADAASAPVAAAASRIVTETVPSARLKRDIPLIVYLPAGYERGNARFPVLYLLHGAGGDERDWTGAAGVQDLADRMIAQGTLPPAIIAMPGCRECWWVDGIKDQAETAFWSELVPAVDARYRTIRSREGRFVAGLSAGGYGAIRFALKYPDRIGAAAALSPAIYADSPPTASAARKQPPFLMADGTFDEDLWDARNYPRLLPAYFAQKHRVPMYLAAGDHDNLGIAYETALLHKRLLEKQPEIAELRVLDGDHNWQLWSATLADAISFVFRHSQSQQTIAGHVTSAPLSPR